MAQQRRISRVNVLSFTPQNNNGNQSLDGKNQIAIPLEFGIIQTDDKNLGTGGSGNRVVGGAKTAEAYLLSKRFQFTARTMRQFHWISQVFRCLRSCWKYRRICEHSL